LGREKFADDLDESAVSRESTAMADIEGYLRKIQGTLKMMKRGKGRNALKTIAYHAELIQKRANAAAKG
jgi:hypothetical protein